ncbi:SurA N-terminal domain-containing protein [Sphingomonas naphthae]|uniref:Parvulin-like PPIase n=1 Tax=Sphingomonas naphthae TaxID=1813468 RepID=A0ABY7TRC8_9SPHN|nr:peptidylprolyl isomerase [Sphingomonas naphthae]WCT74935.1 SurA N-terminal domain-containing protein [Sphingomonas naphthae]
MLAFFRRALSSWIVVALLGLIMLAFAVTGIDTGSMFSGGGGANSVATVGGTDLSADDMRQRAQGEVQQAAQQNPQATMAAYVAQGGYSQLIDQSINGLAIERWAEKQGFVASKRLIDGEIASIPAFYGPTGQFDRNAMLAILARQRLTEAQLRADLKSDIIRRQVLVPIASGLTVAPGLARPYASLLLERREGLIGAVPTATMPEGPQPTAAEIAAAYKRDITHYTLPERRSLRYALFGPESVTAQAKPSEAEIAAAYKAAAATYAPSEKRTVQQVILQDQAAARALVAKVRGGTAFAAAAQGAGFAAGDIAVAADTKPALAKLASPAVATAAYAAPTGSVTDPIKSDFGWHVVHIVSATQVAGKSLDQARAELTTTLEAKKAESLLADKVNRLEDALSGGATFDEAVAKEKLTAATTPPLVQAGVAPEQPDYQLPPELASLLKPAFDATPGDAPTVEALGATKKYAVLALGNVVPSAPQPLAKVRESVVRDIMVRRAAAKAKAVAQQIVDRANKGMPLAQSIAAANLGLKPPQPVNARRMDLERAGQAAPPLQFLFTLGKGKTQLLPLPNDQGFYVIQANLIEPGDVTPVPRLLTQFRGDLARAISNELIEQLAASARTAVGVKRNEQAILKLRGELTGAVAPAQPAQ